ncbi:MAG: phosphoribosylamine--glycine ligase [Acidimicrobiia bacterium]|nr:phosphoribosylamine--glycine ligase [Acidimicrobiia bacterium]
MRVCVVGSGGREHALRNALAVTAEVVVTSGNPGIPGSVATPPEEVEADLFVIGPEVPLVDGLADRLRAGGRLVLGPGADGARLEGSKAWMKQLLGEAGVPTASYATFTEVEPAVAHLRTLAPPYVVKTDGLAAGKGVLVTESLADAADDVAAKLAGRSFGDAGRQVVIEEGLTGPELSVLCVCDGTRAVALAPAQDFKRLGDGDSGPNTGGMGACSPVPRAGAAMVDEVVDTAVQPTLAALRARGIDYRGVLYAGLILTADGPKVLEFNVRFGDPEAQVVLPRFAGDLASFLAEAATGGLRSEPEFVSDAAVTVGLAAEGYPRAPRPGDTIVGLEAAAAVKGVTVYCAGVAAGRDGTLTTAGGRVLQVTGMGGHLAEARERAYLAVSHVSWPGMQYRTDIAASAAYRIAAADAAYETAAVAEESG